MATNFLQHGDSLTVAAPAAKSSGDGVLVGDVLFGVAMADAENGADLVIKTTGVFELPKTSAQAWDVGDAIYWDDDGDGATTATTAGNVYIGVAIEAAANPSSTGKVRLNGSMPPAAESA